MNYSFRKLELVAFSTSEQFVFEIPRQLHSCIRNDFMFADFSCNYFCVRGTRTQPLICVGCSVHYWVSSAINKGAFFEIAFSSSSSSTRICLALRRLLTFRLTLTR